jgi:hypothetical protein
VPICISTDHLSDRELYAVLYQQTLREEHPIVPPQFPMVTHIDLLGGWSADDIRTYLTYYADADERRESINNGYDLPEHLDLPYRRDRLLPHP